MSSRNEFRTAGKKPAVRQLLLGILLPTMILPLFLLSAVSYRTVSGVLTRRIHDDNEALGHSIRREINGFLEMASTITRTVAQEAPFLTGGGNDVPGFLSSVLATVPFFERLTVYDSNGDVTATVPRDEDLIGSNFAAASFFRAVRSGKAGYWSNSFISPVSLKPTVSYSVPLGDGVLSINLNLEILRDITLSADNPGNRKVLITDRDGTVMAFENEAYVTQRRKVFPGSGKPREEILFEGKPYIAQFLLIDKTGWPLFIFSPAVLVTGPLSQIAFSIVLITAAFAALQLLLILRLNSRLTAPIERMVRQAERIADGDYRVTGDVWFREAQALLDAMGSMAATIELREEALQKSEQKYRMLVENAATIIIRWNADLVITYCNEYGAAFFQLGDEREAAGLPLERLLQPDDPLSAKEIWNSPEAYSAYRSRNRKTDGTEVWIQWATKPLYDEDGKLAEILSVGSDITELQNTLKERELLLSEVHHRVKNNLQLIISLLSLKHSQLKESPESVSFRESIAHIYSISLVHEQLYQSRDFNRIELQEYVENIVSHLADSFPASGRPVSFILSARGVEVPIEKAIPCGLVLMELISNALRHAFRTEGRGIVEVTGGSGDGQTVITVRDNGEGFPRERFDEGSSLGFQMIRLMVRQMGGSITLDTRGGSEFRISFRS